MESRRTVTVRGKGGVSVTPDIIRLTVVNRSISPSYEAAYTLAALINTDLSGTLQQIGIEPQEMRTSHFDISKHYKRVRNSDGDWEQRFAGYEFKQQWRIDIDLDKELLGKLISAVGRQLPDCNIEIGYAVRDPHRAELQMLEQAIRDATRKAEVMAAAAGAELGELLSIDYSWHEMRFYSSVQQLDDVDMMVCDSAASMGIDLHPEDIENTDTVTVVWALK